MLRGIAMDSSSWLVNAETQRAGEIRGVFLFSAFLHGSLCLCVQLGVAVATPFPRCDLLWVASLFRLAILVPLLVVSLGIAASGQIMSASATNAAVKKAAPGFVGSQSCRECHEKFYQLWSTSFHGLAMQPYTSELARTNLTEQKTEIVAGKYRFLADIRKSVVFERTAEGEKRYPIVQVMGGKNVYYFLTPLERGWLQVLPVAYDVRRREWFDTTASAMRHFGDRRDEALYWNC